jgi:hypothetical protein
MNHLRFAVLLTVCFTVLVFAACGAENAVAPAAEPQNDMRECRGFEQLMPNFLKVISDGKTENLKRLVETQLLVSERDDVPPPINEVLRVIFKTLNTFALKPKEPGATGTEFCAPTSAPPPLTSANELCEMRRALDLLVHQGKGIDAINLIEPQLLTTVNYLTGTGLDCKGRQRTPHYEVAGILSQFCTQNLNCQLTDGLDMAIALTAYVNTADGKLLVQHLNELAAKPSVTGLLNPQSLTEADMVVIARTLITVVQGAADPMALRNAFDSLPLPDEVKMDLDPVVGDLEKVLGHPEIMMPLKRSLNCLTTTDTNLDTVRMIHRLAIEEQCPEFGLTRLTQALRGVQDVDQRGSLIFIAGTLAKAVRSDELAVDSAASVCRTVFSTRKATGGDCTTSMQCTEATPECDRTARRCVALRSNAQLALPVVGDLVQAGVINEGICAIDTLLFGCAGGMQPACR